MVKVWSDVEPRSLDKNRRKYLSVCVQGETMSSVTNVCRSFQLCVVTISNKGVRMLLETHIASILP